MPIGPNRGLIGQNIGAIGPNRGKKGHIGGVTRPKRGIMCPPGTPPPLGA